MQKNKALVLLGFILAPHMHCLYISDVPTTPGTHNTMFQIIQFYIVMQRLKNLFSTSYRQEY